MATSRSQAHDDGREAELNTSSSSTAPNPAIPAATCGTVSPRSVIMRTLNTRSLPAPKVDEALFLPAGADRTWYLGFLRPWENFNKDAIKYWKSHSTRDAFDKAEAFPVTPLPPVDVTRDHGSEVLHSYFGREALGDVLTVYNLLMNTQATKDDEQPNEIWLSDMDSDNVTNTNSNQEPSYIIDASRNAKDEATRALGQVEYLGGRKGALTWAINEHRRNKWGSLRCVLGEIVQHMLKSSVRYAFLVSADEFMCLRFEIREKVSYFSDQRKTPTNPLVEPCMHYTAPIKWGDVLNEAEGTVPVNLGLLYLLHCSMQEDYKLESKVGNAAKYQAKTKAGADYIPKLS